MTTLPYLTVLPGGDGQEVLDQDPGRPYLANQAIPVEVLAGLYDQQPASQPMSLATAMFYVQYTRGAFRIARQADEFFLVLPVPANLRIAMPGKQFPPGPEGEIG